MPVNKLIDQSKHIGPMSPSPVLQPPRFVAMPPPQRVQNPGLSQWINKLPVSYPKPSINNLFTMPGSVVNTAVLGGFTGQYKGTMGVIAQQTPLGLENITEETIEPVGYYPVHQRGRISGWGEPPALITPHFDSVKLLSILRQAERGETTQLFTIYRDFILDNSHLQSELAKRKMRIIGQPWTIIPYKQKGAKTITPEDQFAADVIEDMIDECENWNEGLSHFLDGILYPCVAAEKIVELNTDETKPWLRWKFRRFAPVSEFLFAYRLAYMATGGFQVPVNTVSVTAPRIIPLEFNRQADVTYNVDSWEPDLRFFRTFPNGYIDYSWFSMYAPDPMRHIIHRGNIISRGIRDNYGGPFRSLLKWAFYIELAKEWFAKNMNKYGHPFIVIKANTENVDTFEYLQSAIKESNELGGLVLNLDANAELEGIDYGKMAEGYTMFLDYCNSEISKIINGHEGSTTAKAEGLNSDQEKTVSDSGDNIRLFDQVMLGHTLETQLFAWYLKINGIPGHVPSIRWAGLGEENATELMTQLMNANKAGLVLSDEGIEYVNEITGQKFKTSIEENTQKPVFNPANEPMTNDEQTTDETGANEQS